MNTQTPLWLELKKEYIDDNFEKLIDYLRDHNTIHDTFYQTTIKLLSARANSLAEEISVRDVPKDEGVIEERQFNIRLLAVMLLVEKNDKSMLHILLALIGELRMIAPNFSQKLLSFAMERIKSNGVSGYGFSWDDIKNFSPEIFAFKLTEHTHLIKTEDIPSWIFGNGSVCINNSGLHLIDVSGEKARTVPLSNKVYDFDFGMSAVSTSVEKVKVKQSNDIEAVRNFTKSFIHSIKSTSSVAKENLSSRKLLYNEGDEVLVRVTRSTDEEVWVETCDSKYEKISGTLSYTRQGIVYYYNWMFGRYLQAGNIIKAHVVDASKGLFSIEKTFIDFLVNDSKKNSAEKMLAKLIDIRNGKMVWLTDFGIPVYTTEDKSFNKDSFAYVSITSYGTDNYYGLIYGNITGAASKNDTFPDSEVRSECIQAFASEESVVNKMEKKQCQSLSPIIIRILLRHLFAHQKHMLKPSERISLLSAARIMAVVVGDTYAEEYIHFESSYLQVLVSFAKGDDMSTINLKIPEQFKGEITALKRRSVVDLLKLWGKKDDDGKLQFAIDNFSETMPMIARLAKIILTSNSMQEIVTGASINVLKREVIKTLSIEVGDESDLEGESGIYLGLESDSVEFKTSVVYPPDNNMQPDESKQTKNILRGVCAMLNSNTGGTLYLGVSDQGYVVGLKSDLDYLKVKNLDTYMRVYVQDKIKTHLGIEVLPNIRLETMYDDQVVAIHIEPFAYKIVELNGKAYIRANMETREMNDTMRQNLLEKKLMTNRSKVANVSMLMQAIQERKQVILHNYSSSNSGSITNRHLEVYNIETNHNLLMAFDLKDNKCKVFNINRIGYIEILEKSWEHVFNHKPIKVDHFHMSGTEKTKCFLELDMLARNLLIEEFPTAKDDITKAGDDNTWYFSTEVYGMSGIGRFYIGLANHIKIVDAPELKKYAKEFKEKYI